MQISDIIPLFTVSGFEGGSMNVFSNEKHNTSFSIHSLQFTWPSLTCLKVIRKELRPHLTRKDGNSITSKS